MEKEYNMKDISNIEELPENARIILDDRVYRYDKVNDRIVRPGEQGYEELPELTL